MAESGKPDKWVAEQLGVTQTAIKKWKEYPEFMSEVERLYNEYAAAVRRKTLASLERRVDSYLNHYDDVEKLLKERGKELADVPGGSTGWLSRDYKGKDANVAVYSFDAGLMRESRALREQIARELGQWTDNKKIESTVTSVEVTRDALRKLTHDELVEYERLLAKVSSPAQIVDAVAVEVEATSASNATDSEVSSETAPESVVKPEESQS